MPASFVEGFARTRRISEFLAIGFGAENRVDTQLEANSQDPGHVDFVVVSHLHFDHVGGLSMLPNATLVIQRKEWEELAKFRPTSPTTLEYETKSGKRGEVELYQDGTKKWRFRKVEKNENQRKAETGTED